MRRLVVPLSIGLILSFTAAALAANPIKGGLYAGTKPGTVSKRITLKVSKNGKSAVANLFCAGTHASTMKNIGIRKGRFSGQDKSGSLVIWKLKGHFTSKSSATAKATLHAICDGGEVSLTLTLGG